MYKIITSLSKSVLLGALTAAVLVVVGALALSVSNDAGAQQAGVLSLRGATEIPDQNTAPTPAHQDTQAGKFERAYRQQPPLIPHKIDGYQIDRGNNECLQCHDWPYNVDQGAPKISETHYISRDGVALDEVAPRRWFCNQCHVPQSDARELVKNDFKSAIDLD